MLLTNVGHKADSRHAIHVALHNFTPLWDAVTHHWPFLKSFSIPDEILNKFGVRGTPDYQRVASKVSRTMGSEWPDKREKPGQGLAV